MEKGKIKKWPWKYIFFGYSGLPGELVKRIYLWGFLVGAAELIFLYGIGPFDIPEFFLFSDSESLLKFYSWTFMFLLSVFTSAQGLVSDYKTLARIRNLEEKAMEVFNIKNLSEVPKEVDFQQELENGDYERKVELANEIGHLSYYAIFSDFIRGRLPKANRIPVIEVKHIYQLFSPYILSGMFVGTNSEKEFMSIFYSLLQDAEGETQKEMMKVYQHFKQQKEKQRADLKKRVLRLFENGEKLQIGDVQDIFYQIDLMLEQGFHESYDDYVELVLPILEHAQKHLEYLEDLKLWQLLGRIYAYSSVQAPGRDQIRSFIEEFSGLREAKESFDLEKGSDLRTNSMFARGGHLSELSEKDPALYNILINRQNAQHLLKALSHLRQFFYDYEIKSFDIRSPLDFLIDQKIYFELAEGLYVTPITHSFRRFILFRMNDEGEVEHAIELKTAGDRRPKIYEESFHYEQDIRNENPHLFVHSLGFIQFPTEGFEMYKNPKLFDKEDYVQMHLFEYKGFGKNFDGPRLSHLNRDAIHVIARKYHKRYKGSTYRVALELTKRIGSFVATIHELGYIGQVDEERATDLHFENFRIILDEDDFRLVNVTDIDSFTEQSGPVDDEERIRYDLEESQDIQISVQNVFYWYPHAKKMIKKYYNKRRKALRKAREAGYKEHDEEIKRFRSEVRTEEPLRTNSLFPWRQRKEVWIEGMDFRVNQILNYYLHLFVPTRDPEDHYEYMQAKKFFAERIAEDFATLGSHIRRKSIQVPEEVFEKLFEKLLEIRNYYDIPYRDDEAVILFTAIFENHQEHYLPYLIEKLETVEDELRFWFYFRIYQHWFQREGFVPEPDHVEMILKKLKHYRVDDSDYFLASVSIKNPAIVISHLKRLAFVDSLRKREGLHPTTRAAQWFETYPDQIQEVIDTEALSLKGKQEQDVEMTFVDQNRWDEWIEIYPEIENLLLNSKNFSKLIEWMTMLRKIHGYPEGSQEAPLAHAKTQNRAVSFSADSTLQIAPNHESYRRHFLGDFHAPNGKMMHFKIIRNPNERDNIYVEKAAFTAPFEINQQAPEGAFEAPIALLRLPDGEYPLFYDEDPFEFNAEEEEPFYIAIYEYDFDGKRLLNMREEELPDFSDDRQLDLAREVLNRLAWVHHMGYRGHDSQGYDIHIENFMIRENSEGQFNVKVVDFDGYNKLSDDEALRKRQIQTDLENVINAENCCNLRGLSAILDIDEEELEDMYWDEREKIKQRSESRTQSGDWISQDVLGSRRSEVRKHGLTTLNLLGQMTTPLVMPNGVVSYTAMPLVIGSSPLMARSEFRRQLESSIEELSLGGLERGQAEEWQEALSDKTLDGSFYASMSNVHAVILQVDSRSLDTKDKAQILKRLSDLPKGSLILEYVEQGQKAVLSSWMREIPYKQRPDYERKPYIGKLAISRIRKELETLTKQPGLSMDYAGFLVTSLDFIDYENESEIQNLGFIFQFDPQSASAELKALKGLSAAVLGEFIQATLLDREARILAFKRARSLGLISLSGVMHALNVKVWLDYRAKQKIARAA